MSPIFKTGLFLAALTALLVALGYSFGGRNGALFFFGFSLIINIGSYFFSEKIALAMTRAKPLLPEQMPHLHADVKEIAERMKIPMPKVYYSEDRQANAFATGRNPKNSSICFTKGIIELLDKRELKGVIAHELSHIKNYDVLISTLAAVLAGGISAIADAARWFSFGSHDDEDRNPIATIAMIIIAPIAAFLIQLAISRQREFAADQTGGKFTNSPLDLANALAKIDSSVRRNPMHVNPALSSLYIENPLKTVGIMKLFSTHPPTEERIKRLEELARGVS